MGIGRDDLGSKPPIIALLSGDNDIAPVEYPVAADPFLTVALVKAARELRRHNV